MDTYEFDETDDTMEGIDGAVGQDGLDDGAEDADLFMDGDAGEAPQLRFGALTSTSVVDDDGHDVLWSTTEGHYVDSVTKEPEDYWQTHTKS